MRCCTHTYSHCSDLRYGQGLSVSLCGCVCELSMPALSQWQVGIDSVIVMVVIVRRWWWQAGWHAVRQADAVADCCLRIDCQTANRTNDTAQHKTQRTTSSTGNHQSASSISQQDTLAAASSPSPLSNQSASPPTAHRFAVQTWPTQRKREREKAV